MTMSGSVWTEQQIEDLKRLTEDGWTGTQIGDYIGKSRNAVIGKQHRLGIFSKNGGRRILTPEEREQQRRRHNARSRGSRLLRIKRRHERAMDNIVKVLPITPVLRLSLLELQEHHCRYPVTDDTPHLFCGRHVIAGSSWCEFHWHVVYESARPRRFLQAAE